MTRSEIDTTIRAVLEQARVRAGSAAALASQLQEMGIGPDAGSYSPSAVSNWIRGRVRPPADVVLAASRLYSLPLGTGADSGSAPGSSASKPEAPVRPPSRPRPEVGIKDVVAVFSSRSEAQAAYPFIRLIAGAAAVDMMGLSLNSLCQGISDVTLGELIENGLVLRCLFLDPDGQFSKQREVAENLPGETLHRLTSANLHVLETLKSKLSQEAQERLLVRIYDQEVRYNITIADDSSMLVQQYLYASRGIDSPGFLIEQRDDEPHGLFQKFRNEFDLTWQGATPV